MAIGIWEDITSSWNEMMIIPSPDVNCSILLLNYLLSISDLHQIQLNPPSEHLKDGSKFTQYKKPRRNKNKMRGAHHVTWNHFIWSFQFFFTASLIIKESSGKSETQSEMWSSVLSFNSILLLLLIDCYGWEEVLSISYDHTEHERSPRL